MWHLFLLLFDCRHVGNIAVRCGIGGSVGSILLLADVEEVDVLGVYSQLCMGGAVLTLPLVNLHVALDGQNTPLGEILSQFQMCRVTARCVPW